MVDPDLDADPDGPVVARQHDDRPIEIHGPGWELEQIVRRASPARLVLRFAILALLVAGGVAGARFGRHWLAERRARFAPMAHIPGGNVFIGERVAPSQPRKSYEIGLEPYDIDVFEVTVAAYAACVETGRCPLPRKGGFCNWGKEKVDTHPINCVDQRQAERYCTWVNKRLPTSEEWEHAARGDDERRFPWGAAPPSPRRLNACGVECRILGADHDRVLGTMYEEDDGFPVTAPVGSFPAGKSPFGLHDVEGNVSEWTSSGFVDLPNWPTGFEKAYVVRGASWGSGREANAEVWAREGIDRNEAMETVGFRCAR